MPWHLDSEHPDCSGWAVVKDADGSVAGCHATKDDAMAQMAALYANEPGMGRAAEAMPMSASAMKQHLMADPPAGHGKSEADMQRADMPMADMMAMHDKMHSATTPKAEHSHGPAEIKSRPPRDTLVRNQPGDFEVRDESGGPVMTGHFSVFNQWTEINSKVEGRFMERVAPGAFAKAFAENADRIRVTFNHGKDVLGDQLLGRPTVLEEDDQGARYEVQLFEGIPPLIMAGLRERAYGSSFRFRVTKDDFNDKPKRSAFNPEAIPERTIKEAQVFEFGPVTYPAYDGATAGIRSGTDDYLLSLIRGANALPDDGAEAEPHSDAGSREEPPVTPPPVARPIRRVSDEEWLAFLAKESSVVFPE